MTECRRSFTRTEIPAPSNAARSRRRASRTRYCWVFASAESASHRRPGCCLSAGIAIPYAQWTAGLDNAGVIAATPRGDKRGRKIPADHRAAHPPSALETHELGAATARFPDALPAGSRRRAPPLHKRDRLPQFAETRSSRSGCPTAPRREIAGTSHPARPRTAETWHEPVTARSAHQVGRADCKARSRCPAAPDHPGRRQRRQYSRGP